MFRYYFLLGLRSLKRNPALTALMIITLAIGVAASVSTLTILHVMSGDPIPHKSRKLIMPLLDVAPKETYVPGEKDPYANQSTYKDSVNFLKSGQGVRRTALYDAAGSVEPARREDPVVDLQGIATTADYFKMFEVPFMYGAPWSAAEDDKAAKVAVLSRKKAETLFGKVDPVGKRFRLWNDEWTVIGVVPDWSPTPRYMHLVNGSGGFFAGEEEIYVPMASAVAHEIRSSGNTNCSRDSGNGYEGFLKSECTWVQFWWELASESDRPALQAWVDGYVKEQQRLGRFDRNAPNTLYNVPEWMERLEVVKGDTRAAVWLSFGFLLLCMVNTMGLLLAKFSSRASEVGVRRALGASRAQVFRQYLIETGVVGATGGVLGLALSFGALALIRQSSRDLSVVANMDWAMLATTFAIALGASLFAGLLPTWRACQVTPAIQLKSQ